MNKQGPGKIEWCDWTFNPISGCRNNCPYCYAAAQAHRFNRSFEPAFHPKRLTELGRLKEPSVVFVCSTADFFGPGVELEWQQRTIAAMQTWPDNEYVILTKCPGNAWDWCDENVIAGITAEDHTRYLVRVGDWDRPSNGALRVVSFEPLLGPVILDEVDVRPEWVIVGGMTGRVVKRPPETTAWAHAIADQCRELKIPCFVKSNAGFYQEEWHPAIQAMKAKGGKP